MNKTKSALLAYAGIAVLAAASVFFSARLETDKTELPKTVTSLSGKQTLVRGNNPNRTIIIPRVSQNGCDSYIPIPDDCKLAQSINFNGGQYKIERADLVKLLESRKNKKADIKIISHTDPPRILELTIR